MRVNSRSSLAVQPVSEVVRFFKKVSALRKASYVAAYFELPLETIVVQIIHTPFRIEVVLDRSQCALNLQSELTLIFVPNFIVTEQRQSTQQERHVS